MQLIMIIILALSMIIGMVIIEPIPVSAPGNPIADAGEDKNVLKGTTVRLDGSGSHDPDGQIVSYRWSEVGDVRHFGISDYDRSNAHFTAPDVSSTTKYTIRLVVTDNNGYRDADTVDIYVKPLLVSPEMAQNLRNIIPPGRVTDLTVTTVSSTQLDLDWTTSTASDLDHYNIYRGESSGFAVNPRETQPYDISNTNSYSDDELDPSTTYYFKVAAVDDEGHIGPPSSEKSGTTEEEPPADEGTPADEAEGIYGGDYGDYGFGGENTDGTYYGEDECVLDPVTFVCENTINATDAEFLNESTSFVDESLLSIMDNQTRSNFTSLKSDNTTVIFVPFMGNVTYLTGLDMNISGISTISQMLNKSFGIKSLNNTEIVSKFPSNSSNVTLIFISTIGNITYQNNLDLNTTGITQLKDNMTRNYISSANDLLFPHTDNLTDSEGDLGEVS